MSDSRLPSAFPRTHFQAPFTSCGNMTPSCLLSCGPDSLVSVDLISFGPGSLVSVDLLSFGPGSLVSVDLLSFGPGSLVSVDLLSFGPGSLVSVDLLSHGALSIIQFHMTCQQGILFISNMPGPNSSLRARDSGPMLTETKADCHCCLLSCRLLRKNNLKWQKNNDFV